ncbi:MAG: alpha/beta hydrolase [Polyangiaceae bacterium]
MTEPTTSHLDVDGATLFVTRWPGPASAMPILLLHGGPGLWDYLGEVGAALSDLGEVMSYDQRACGRSTGGLHDLARAVADLDAVAAAFTREPLVLVGHSWGASLALAYCLAHPERVRGVVYACGVGVDPNWRLSFTRRFAAMTTGLELPTLVEIEIAPPEERARLTREILVRRWAVELVHSRGAEARAATLLVPGVVLNLDLTRSLSPEVAETLEGEEVLARARKLDMPFLLVHGELDPRPIESVEPLARALPHAELVRLSMAGHFAWLDDPQGFFGAIRQFVARLASRSG